MRPLKLTLEAFGPFAGKEVIDFTQIVDQQLFGIYGQTGSGKSSIFEAIAFALFGKDLKKNVDNLRSDHSDVNTLCQVEFIFEASNNKYLVQRSPKQSNEKRKNIPAESYLFDITGIHEDDISKTNRGRILAEKKVEDTSKEIENILGYGIEQFGQIVLLPQGEFEKFLLSPTKDKKQILSKLFDVSLYENLARKFSEDSKEIKDKIASLTDQKKGQLKTHDFSSTEELENSIKELKNKTEELQKKATVDNDNFDKIKKTKEKKEDLDKAKDKRTKLLSKKAEYDQLEKTIKKISNAEKLQAPYSVVEEKKSKYNKDKKKIDNCNEDLKNIEKDIKENKKERVKFEQRKEEFNKKSEQLGEFKDYEKRLESSKDDQREIILIKKQLENVNASIKRKDLEKSLEEALANENKKKKFELLQSEVKNLKTSTMELKNELKKASLAFDKAEQDLSEMQAIHLSAKLADGEACPVCGSHDHPSPAKGHAESKGLHDAFEKAKEYKEKIKVSYDEKKSLLASKEGQITGFESTFSDHISSSEIKLKISELNFEYKEDEKSPDINELKINKESQVEKINQLVGSLNRLLKGIPEKFQNIDTLTLSINTLEDEINDYEAQRKILEENDRKNSVMLVKLKSAKKVLSVSFINLQNQLKKAEEDFFKNLKQHEFQDKDEFEKYLSRLLELKTEQEKLDYYKRSISEADGVIKNLQETTKNIDQIDTDQLQAEFDEMYSLKKASQDQLTSNENKITNLEHLKVKVDEIETELQQLKDGHLSLINLSDAFNAKEKGQRIGLETFALRKMFELVLKAANKRLRIMTKRYQLEIETETKGTGEHGLQISVNDIFTGRGRPIQTLSGGETFMASLSLALGLSDIAQSSSQKNIRLDTIFIDEGFGSLDSENGFGTLGDVLNTLQENVASSRAVGLISHVDTVKSAVPAGFYVEKTPNGSHIRLLSD